MRARPLPKAKWGDTMVGGGDGPRTRPSCPIRRCTSNPPIQAPGRQGEPGASSESAAPFHKRAKGQPLLRVFDGREGPRWVDVTIASRISAAASGHRVEQHRSDPVSPRAASGRLIASRCGASGLDPDGQVQLRKMRTSTSSPRTATLPSGLQRDCLTTSPATSNSSRARSVSGRCRRVAHLNSNYLRMQQGFLLNVAFRTSHRSTEIAPETVGDGRRGSHRRLLSAKLVIGLHPTEHRLGVPSAGRVCETSERAGYGASGLLLLGACSRTPEPVQPATQPEGGTSPRARGSVRATASLRSVRSRYAAVLALSGTLLSPDPRPRWLSRGRCCAQRQRHRLGRSASYGQMNAAMRSTASLRQESGAHHRDLVGGTGRYAGATELGGIFGNTCSKT
jgi:hypothetical protein